MLLGSEMQFLSISLERGDCTFVKHPAIAYKYFGFIPLLLNIESLL